MEPRISYERYRQIKAAIRKILKHMTDNGMIKQFQMYRSSQAFDYQPMMDTFEQMLTKSREQGILQVRQEIERTMFQIRKLRTKLGEKVDEESLASDPVGLANWDLLQSVQRVSTKVQESEKNLTAKELSRQKSLDHENQRCTIANGLMPQTRRVLANVKLGLIDARNEIEEVIESYSMTFETIKRRIKRESLGLSTKATGIRRETLDNKLQELEKQVSDAKQSRKEFETSLLSFFRFLSSKNGETPNDEYPGDQTLMIENLIMQEQDRARLHIEKQVCDRWGSPNRQTFSTAETILATIHTKLKTLEERQNKSLEENRRRRHILQRELNTLIIKMKSMETEPILSLHQDASFLSDLDQTREEFQRKTEMIDDSLRELALSHTRYTNRYFR